MVELIDKYVLREGIEDDTDFLVKQLGMALAALERLNKAKVDLRGANSFTKAGEAAGKMKTELDALQKAEQDLARVTEQRKKASADIAKQIAAEKEALRQQNQELKNSAREQRAAEGSIEQMRAALIRLNKEYDNLSAADRNSERGVGLKDQVKAISDELKKLEGDTGRFQRNVGNYSGAVKTLEKALNDVRGKMDQYNQSGQASAETIEALAREEALLSQLVETQAAGFASASQELRKNEQALQALGQAGLQQTEFYRELLNETAQLRDNVGDLREEIKNLSSDTTTLDGLIQSAEGLTGMYGVAQGAAALFGDENEELQETFVKLQAAMTILNGLQAIRNVMQSQSSAMLLLERGRTLAVAAAQRVLAFATAQATAGARALNGALLAGGFTAVLVLLPMVISAMSSLGDETDDTTESIEDQQKALKALNQEYLASADASEKRRNAAKGGLDDLNRELKLLEARGATEGELFQKRKQIFEAEMDNLKTRRYTVKEDGETEVAIEKEILDKRIEMQAAQLAYEKKAADESKKIAKERADKSKEYMEKERKAQYDLIRLSLEDSITAAQATVNSQAASLADRLAARALVLEKEKAIANAERDYRLQSEKLTASEVLVIRAEAAKKIRDLEAQAVKDAIEIRARVAQAQKDEAAAIAAEGKAFQDSILERQVKGFEREFTNRIDFLESAAYREEKVLLDLYKRGEVSKEEYERRKLEIENNFRKEALLAEIAYQQELIRITDLPAEEKAEAEKRLNDLKKELREEDLRNEAVAAEKSLEIAKRRNEKLVELGNEIKDLAFTFLTAGIDKQKNAVQEEINLIEERKKKDIEAASQAITNAQDRTAAILEIEARANAAREAMERRKRALDEQRARYERMKNIADIIQSTAIAVVSTLGAKPWTPANIALAAIVGAIGAAQIARVLATPIPKFKHGKDKNNNYEGPAIVGDGGKKEAILRADGSVEITPDTPTLTYVGAKDIVLPDARELAEQQFRMAVNGAGKLVQGYSREQKDSQRVEKAINKLGSRLENAIKHIPQPHITTANPIDKWVKGHDTFRRL